MLLVNRFPRKPAQTCFCGRWGSASECVRIEQALKSALIAICVPAVFSAISPTSPSQRSTRQNMPRFSLNMHELNLENAALPAGLPRARDDMLRFLKDHADAALHATQHLVRDCSDAYGVARRIGLSHSVSERFARFLLETAADGEVSNGTVRVRQAMTHEGNLTVGWHQPRNDHPPALRVSPKWFGLRRPWGQAIRIMQSWWRAGQVGGTFSRAAGVSWIL